MGQKRRNLRFPPSLGGGGGTPQATEQERALAEIGAEQWSDYVERGVPMISAFKERLRDPKHTERLEGQSNAATAAATAHDMKKAIEASLGSGDASGSGSSVMTASLAPLRRTSIAGGAAAGARDSARAREQTGMIKLSAYGRGLSDDASVVMQSAGENATRKAIAEADMATQDYLSNLNALSTAAGYVGSNAIREYNHGSGLAQFARDNPFESTGIKISEPEGLWAGMGYRNRMNR